MEARARDGRIILTPERKRPRKAVIVRDRVTGLPVLSAGKGAAPLTGKQVREILAEFP